MSANLEGAAKALAQRATAGAKPKKGKPKRSRKAPATGRSGRLWRWLGVAATLVVLVLGNLFAHQPTAVRAGYGALEPTLEAIGSITADLTDCLGLTGRDAQIPYDKAPGKGPLPFGVPQVKDPTLAPRDIRLLKRQGYWVGYSPTLGHPVWAAYAVPAQKLLSGSPPRPPFEQDKEVPGSPSPETYTGSGYDRGHMAPNSVIATRYGKAAQKQTFLMTNIAPQRPDLNRGPWRALEQTIADDLSEIGDTVWVIVCTVPDARKPKLKRGRVRIPSGFAMVIASIHRGHLRAIGAYMPQEIPASKRPRYCFRSIRDLEARSGLDFFPALSESEQAALETPEVTRFWSAWGGVR
ncbi:MAG: DNA/RNA non-specific endonuclease [Lentisphaeraceae bacterium]|nr:DNA/RNA non-specific endonuclease [Lentisphaeraceae bacterium]